MSFLPQNIVELVSANKKLVRRPIWNSRDDDRFHFFTAPLTVEDNPIAGFELRAKFSKIHVDRDCLLQLEFSRGGRDRVELARSQWRPFETHTNKAWGPAGYEFCRFLGQSHIHAFEDNYLADQRRMRSGSLPGAVPITPDPGTLSEFVAFSGERFKIINMDMIELPQQTGDMFWVKDDPSF